MKNCFYILLFGMLASGCQRKMENLPEVHQWTTFEIILKSEGKFANAYTDVEVWAMFEN